MSIKGTFECAFRHVRQVFGTCSETPWTLGFFLVRNRLNVHGEIVNRKDLSVSMFDLS